MKNNSILKKYEERVDYMIELFPPIEERNREIEALNEEFFKELGENLPNYLLDKLGTWLLKEVYADKRANKIQLEDYPVLSVYQLDRRGRKEVLTEEETTLACLDYHIKNSSTRKRLDKNE